MPIYEYRCRKGHTFEVMQSMSDDPITACSECGAFVERVYHPVAVHFKGSGFYTTDYGRKRGGSGDSATAGDAAKKDSKETTTKSDSASGSESSVGSGSGESESGGSTGKSESSSKSEPAG